jgi:hypothetical protein
LPVSAALQLSCTCGTILREIDVTDPHGDHHSISVPVAHPRAGWLGYLLNQCIIDSVTRLEQRGAGRWI